MGWIEKLETAQKALIDNSKLPIVFDTAKPASERFVQSIESKYPWAESSYFKFLRYTDGAQIWMYVLAGSGNSSFPAIEQLEKRWTPHFGNEVVLPFGEDGGSSCTCLLQEGPVLLVSYTMESAREGEMLASSFDDFLDNVLMGKRFVELFPGGVVTDPENEWYEFLINQGWT